MSAPSRSRGSRRSPPSSSIGASTIAIFDVPTAQDLFDKDGKFDEIQVAAKHGVTPEKLAGEIRPLLPATAQVKTAAAQTQEAVDDVNEGVGIFQKILLAFGFIALFVGAFVIANTLSITIAQRMREFATLRTIGGSRRQVLRSVMLEALVVGLMASLIGLFFGLAIAKGLNALFSALGVEFPSGGTVFATRTIVVSILVGVVVTLLASLRPAIKATRVPPIAAVREGATLPTSRLSRWGPIVSIVTLALGILLLVYGIFGGGLTTATRLLGARLRHADPLRRRGDERQARGSAARRRARLARDAGSAARPARSRARTRCGIRAGRRRRRPR